MALSLVINLSYTVFLATSLSTILFTLLKSVGAIFSSSISTSSTSSFKLAKSDFVAKLDESTPVAPFKYAFVA